MSFSTVRLRIFFCLVTFVAMASPAVQAQPIVQAAPIDVAILLDNSASADRFHADFKNRFGDAHQKLVGLGYDPRYALVTYNSAARIEQDLTDFDTLNAALAALPRPSGGEENASLGVLAAADISFRPGAPINFVLATDDEDESGTDFQRGQAARAALEKDALLWVLRFEGDFSWRTPYNYIDLLERTASYDTRGRPLLYDLDEYGRYMPPVFSEMGFHPHNVPEPASLALLAAGALALLRRRGAVGRT